MTPRGRGHRFSPRGGEPRADPAVERPAIGLVLERPAVGLADVRGDPPPYVEQIQSACRGDPTTDEDAREECLHRSPREHLEGARDAGLPIYIGHGLQDDIVRPHAPLLAFNQLADEEDRLPDEVIRTAYDNELPDELRGSVETETYFGEPDPEVVFARQSGPVTVVLFEGSTTWSTTPGSSGW